ncbi:TatD family hydrolase [Paludibacter sp.]
MIDTHAHIYAEEFDADRNQVIERAIDAGVKKIILPNIDSTSLKPMLTLETEYPDLCYAAIGLHPTSIDERYESELMIVKSELIRRRYIALGEIGIDLYWDKTYVKEQIIAFQRQVEWAIQYDLPLIIHVRESLKETLQALEPYKNSGLKGVFHSFGGSVKDAEGIFSYGDFYLGINGIITFKNSMLSETIEQIGCGKLIIETDAPYLAPTPYRGKRNESAYLTLIAKKIADILNMSFDEVVEITSKNATLLFTFSQNN